MQLSPALITGLLAIGACAGFLSGLVGIGGGIIIVPSLIFLLGFTQHQAQGTSLAVLMLPVVGLGAYEYYRRGHITPALLPAIGVMAVAFVAGSWLGGRTANVLPDDVLRRVFGALLLVLGVKFLFFGK